MIVKGYIRYKKSVKDSATPGSALSKSAYEAVKRGLEQIKNRPILDNFDLNKPPVGRIIDWIEDDIGILVTAEVTKKVTSMKDMGSISIGGRIERTDPSETLGKILDITLMEICVEEEE